MTIYLDLEYKCHFKNPSNIWLAMETSVFDGKCQEFVEGCRFVPAGESWTREDGTVFYGEMRSPWRDSMAIMLAQAQYEQSEAEHMAETAELVEMIYANDMGVINNVNNV